MIRDPRAIGAAVRPRSSVTAAAPEANPGGRGDAADLEARQSFVAVDGRNLTFRPVGLHARSVARAESAQDAVEDEPTFEV